MTPRVGAFRRIVLATAIIAASARSARAGHYAWTTSGPLPGGVVQLLINPQDPDRLAACTGFYGAFLFQSADRGQSWTQPPGLVFAGRLTPDPSDGNVFYTIGYYGGASGVLKSSDGGATWNGTGPGAPAIPFLSQIAVSPSSPRTVYALRVDPFGPDAVFRSADGGVSWMAIPTAASLDGADDLRVDPQNPDVLYLITDADVMKSVDSGATWQPTGLGPAANRLVIDPADPQRIFVGMSGLGVYASPDGGATWVPANVGLETGWVRDLALDPSHPDTLWAATVPSSTSGGGLYVTTNAHDWSPVDLGEDAPVANAVAINPSDSDEVFVGAGRSPLIGGVFHTVDGGATWSRADQGVSGFSNGGVDAHVAEPARAFSVALSKVFQTDDSGDRWSLLADTGFALLDLTQDPSSPDTLYAGYVFPDFSGNGALKSEDGGATWNPATNGLSVQSLHRLAAAPSAPGHVLAASHDGLFQTLDGGGQWTPILSGGADVRTAAYDPLDSGILYACAYGSLQRSPDGGMGWETPAGLPPLPVNNWDVAAPLNDPDRVYLATSVGVYRSVDRGLGFAPASSGLPAPPAAIPFGLAADPSRAGTLYLLTMLGGAATDSPFPANVFRTSDGGDSWTSLPGSLPLSGTMGMSVSADGHTLYASTFSGTFAFRRSFLDVPDDDAFWSAVDAAAMNGVTAGCGGGRFCPTDVETRAAMAVFLLRGKHGSGFEPPPATGKVFGDVPIGSPAAAFIEELYHEGVTVGCGGGDYCPNAPLSRAEAAVLLLKMEHGAGYEPPPPTGTVFADVPADAFAAAWIERLAAEGVTAGCGGGNFCPDESVTRAQAAAFVVLVFGLS
jgi:photosystem II stability/assembly factor-like uncharacterized protein